MSTFNRRSHDRHLSSGRSVHVSKHQVKTSDSPRFVGYGSSGSIARGNAPIAHDGAYDSIIEVNHIGFENSELADEKTHSVLIPNAQCPVCGEAVFFYSNSAGSAVFFDEVGRPWPKHPCTNRTLYVSKDQNFHPTPRITRVAVAPFHNVELTVQILQVVKYRKIGLSYYVELIDPDNKQIIGSWKTSIPVSVRTGQMVLIEEKYMSYVDQISTNAVVVIGELEKH